MPKPRIARHALTACAALALAACASSRVLPLPPDQVIARVTLAQPLAVATGCLERALSDIGSVAGVAPTTLRVPIEGGLRLEQWFITSSTHQRVTYELRSLDAQTSEVAIGLLQKHGQYERANFAGIARGAVERCAGQAAAWRQNANALVRSPAFSRTPGSGSRSKRLVMNLMIDVVS